MRGASEGPPRNALHKPNLESCDRAEARMAKGAAAAAAAAAAASSIFGLAQMRQTSCCASGDVEAMDTVEGASSSWRRSYCMTAIAATGSPCLTHPLP